MPVVEPGKWYFSVTCHHCDRGIALTEDPNQGHGGFEVSQPEAELECPHCLQKAFYSMAEVQTGPGIAPVKH